MLARRQAGMSIVEVLVAMVVLAVMLTAAVPAYTAWVQNTQIRTAAESIKNGIQLARAEAIQTNRLVRFNITAGSGWKVNPEDDPDKDPPIAERAHNDGSPNVTIATIPADATEIVFDSFGRVVTPPFPLSQVEIDNPVIVSADDKRILRIVITTAGSARLCDPKILSPSDTRRC